MSNPAQSVPGQAIGDYVSTKVLIGWVGRTIEERSSKVSQNVKTNELTAQSAVANAIGMPLMAVGPATTVIAMIAERHTQIFRPPGALGYGLACVLFMWNPFVLSLPAALFQCTRWRNARAQFVASLAGALVAAQLR